MAKVNRARITIPVWGLRQPLAMMLCRGTDPRPNRDHHQVRQMAD